MTEVRETWSQGILGRRALCKNPCVMRAGMISSYMDKIFFQTTQEGVRLAVSDERMGAGSLIPAPFCVRKPPGAVRRAGWTLLYGRDAYVVNQRQSSDVLL